MHTKKDWKCCPDYDGSFEVVNNPPTFMHQRKAVCKYCKHFLHWLPNEKTIQDQKKWRDQVDQLLHSKRQLLDYDRNFLEELQYKEKLTPHQWGYLQDLVQRASLPNNIL